VVVESKENLRMLYRRLGKSGLKVSEFSLGAWVTFGKQVDVDLATRMMAVAYDSGVNFFDNAEGYEGGNAEQVMGEALKRLCWNRDTFAVSTKVFWGGEAPMARGLSRKHIIDACENGLRRLGVEYLDMYFCHRPDLDTPIEETVWAMHNLVTQGKVCYWGTSQWTAQQITEAWGFARANSLTPPTMEQPHYNLFERQNVESEYLPLYDLIGLGTTTWSPLASGVLTNKYATGVPADSRMNLPGYEWLKEQWQSEEGKKKLETVGELARLAETADMPLHHMALLWCLRNPQVSTVILGASRIEQLEDNLSALDSRDKLTDDLVEEIETIVDNKPPPAERY
jgi:voltage-dependent potassium channel beta subunit